MKRLATITAFAAFPFIPLAGTAQVGDHVSTSLSLGLSAHSYAAHGAQVGFGFSFGIGLGFSLHHRDPYYDSHHFGLHDPLWPRPLHCWDSFWFDPFQPCHGYFAVGYPTYDYWGWYSPWRFGFLGWPSPRYVRSHWWSPPFWTHYYSPFWADSYAWGFGRRGWGYGYDRWDRYYPVYRPYYDYADPHSRVVRRSPLYGPRYKEYPAPPVYVTDNGPERPVSRAVPRSLGPGGVFDGTDSDGNLDRRGARLTDGPRTARPRTGTDARAARPRTGAETRTSPPRVRARPAPTARPAPSRRPGSTARSAPTRRPAPGVRSAPSSRRPSPAVRSAPSSRRPTPTVRSAPSSRRPTPTVRSAPSSRRPTPTVRSAPSSRRPTPTVRSAPSRTPPKVRRAPSRAPKPSVRAAPRGSSSRKAPPRRPARRPGA